MRLKKKYMLTKINSIYICTGSAIDHDVIQGCVTSTEGPGETKTSFIHSSLDEDVFFFANHYHIHLVVWYKLIPKG